MQSRTKKSTYSFELQNRLLKVCNKRKQSCNLMQAPCEIFFFSVSKHWLCIKRIKIGWTSSLEFTHSSLCSLSYSY